MCPTDNIYNMSEMNRILILFVSRQDTIFSTPGAFSYEKLAQKGAFSYKIKHQKGAFSYRNLDKAVVCCDERCILRRSSGRVLL